MKCINFIPAGRRQARQRRRRLRWWGSGCVTFAVGLALAYLACYGVWGGGRNALGGELDKTTEQIRQSSQALNTTQRELSAAEALLKAKQGVGSQPDWSTLLMLLAKSLDDEVVLRQCELKPDRPAPAAPPPEAPGDAPAAYLLKIAGYGRSQAAVSQFVLHLEQVVLFDQVKLIRSTREAFLADQAVGFQVECALGGKGGSTQ